MDAFHLSCERELHPVGLDRLNPLLGWQLDNGTKQSAYQIQVASSKDLLVNDAADLWDSGVVESTAQVDITYAGAGLKSFQVCFWRVRVRGDKDDECGAWSEIAEWSMGILNQDEWQGQWLSYPVSGCHDASYYRGALHIKGNVKRAFIAVTSRGIYEAYINEHKINPEYFSPGWTDYDKRIYYRIYDITDKLQTGDNVLGGVISEGWYKGQVGFQGAQTLYGYECMLRMHLHLVYDDGSIETFATNDQWKTRLGSVLQSSFLMGEHIDPAHEPVGWLDTDYDDSDWSKPVCYSDGQEYWNQKYGKARLQESNLQAHPGSGVEVFETFSAQDMWETDAGSWVFDMGQNIAGWARIKVKGRPGTMLRCRFAEVLQSDKTLYVENLRSASSTDTYIIRSNDVEVFEPRFTFHGFQYIEVTGVEGLALSDVEALAVTSITQNGHFKCSHDGINKLVSNCWYTQCANFIDIPTDCPQRDERLGWTGDALAFVKTASYTAHVNNFFNKWIVDVIDTQKENGAVTDTAPNGCFYEKSSDAAWGDALTGCPMTMYQFFGNKRIVEESYPAMQRWVDYYKSTSNDWIRDSTNCYGDWLDDDDETSHPLLLTAYFAYSVDQCAQAAAVLGKDKDAQQYREWWQHIVTAFQQRFINADGIIESDSQTAIVVCLDMDLLPEADRAKYAQRLVDKIQARGNRLSTGFVGTHLLLPVLSRFGHDDIAYALLQQTAYPSWLFPIEQGATSIWERWNGWTPENGPGDPSMNSYAHYAFGAVVEWLYANMAGISPASPGFETFYVSPTIGAGIDWVECSYQSPYGLIVSNWKKSVEGVAIALSVPANSTAVFHVDMAIKSIDGHPLSDFSDGQRAPIELHGGRSYQILLATN